MLIFISKYVLGQTKSDKHWQIKTNPTNRVVYELSVNYILIFNFLKINFVEQR